ncbi:MAG: hypothetical protein ACM3XZ_03320 [Betaproteobacteria bacterium]
MKRLRVIVLLGVALLLWTTAATLAAEYGIGYQFFAPFSGLSVKIPLNEDLTLQPVAIAHSDQDGSSYTLAGRLLFDLGEKNGIARYWAAGAGIRQRQQQTMGVNVSLGAEFRKAQFGAPSIEVAVYAGKEEGSAAPLWGTALNFGWHFWF